jgi:hypothetical protein
LKAYWGSGGTALCMLDLGTRWKCVVSFTLRPPYPPGKEPLVPIGKKAGTQWKFVLCVKFKSPLASVANSSLCFTTFIPEETDTTVPSPPPYYGHVTDNRHTIRNGRTRGRQTFLCCTLFCYHLGQSDHVSVTKIDL